MIDLFYMCCIILIQTLHGAMIVLTQWDVVYDLWFISAPAGILTGWLFSSYKKSIKKK